MPLLALPGARLHYEAVGDGTVLVLVHGLLLDARMWDLQVTALSSGAKLVRYDVRGFGRSHRDDVTPYTHPQDLWMLLDHLGVEEAVLVGLSMGGRIVLEAALEQPERTAGLVLLDAVLDGVAWDEESAQGMASMGDAFHEGGPASARAAWLKHPFFGPARRTPDVSQRLGEMVAECPDSYWSSPDPHGPHPDCVNRLDTLDVPTEVVLGELDVAGFHTMAHVLATNIPGARLTVVPDAGHMVNMEAPDVVNRVLKRAAAAAPPR